jgi:hypothetical protein
MHTDKRPEDNDEEAVDKYLNMLELIMNMGTSNERHGQVVKRSRGLASKPIGHGNNANPLFDTAVNMRLSSRTELEITTRRMVSPRICLHKLTVKATSSSSYRKSLTTRRTTARFRYRKEWSKAQTVNQSPRLQQEDGSF